jgi:hypothetical protein
MSTSGEWLDDGDGGDGNEQEVVVFDGDSGGGGGEELDKVLSRGGGVAECIEVQAKGLIS